MTQADDNDKDFDYDDVFDDDDVDNDDEKGNAKKKDDENLGTRQEPDSSAPIQLHEKHQKMAGFFINYNYDTLATKMRHGCNSGHNVNAHDPSTMLFSKYTWYINDALQ